MFLTYCQLQENNCFYFQKKSFLAYWQIDCVEMGSPLDLSLANDFICHYEKEL